MIEWIFQSYKYSLGILVIISLLSLISLAYGQNKLEHWINLSALGGGFSSIFGICVLVALTAYSQIDRPLMSASIPMLAFIAYTFCMAGNIFSSSHAPDTFRRQTP